MSAFAKVFIIVLFLAMFGVIADALEPKTISDEENAALKRGETIIEVWKDKSRADGAVDVYGAIDIMASPDIIWAMMLDCKQALLIVKAMRLCEVLETSSDGSWDVRKQKVKIGPLLPKSVNVFRSDYTKPKSIKISLVRGNMQVQEGRWDLQVLGKDKTRVSYRAALKPKFPVPKRILMKGVRSDVPEVLTNMRKYAEMAQEDANIEQTNDVGRRE